MILVTGSLAFDYIMDYEGVFSDHIMPDKIHKINLSFLVSTLKREFGGTAGNIAYSLALLDQDVSILATAGSDFEPYQKFLDQSGVDTKYIKIIDKKHTASAFIMTDKMDNQITGFYPGAMSEAGKLSLKDLKSKPGFAVISPNDPSAIIKLADECRDLKIPFMIDMGMQLPALTPEEIKKILEGAEVLIGNDYEMDLLKEKSGFNDKDFLKSVKIILTTLGPKGSQITTGRDNLEIKAAKPKEVVDPTGAGDAFRAGFLAGYLEGMDLKVCAQMGSIAACYTIEKYGTTTHNFTLEEFKKRYKENFGEDLEL